MTLSIEIIILVGTHIFLAIISWYYSKHIAEKKKIFQFYNGLKPVIELVANIRKQGKINKDEAKQFIQTISKSFSANFNIGIMLTKDYGVYDNQTKIECGICGEEEHKLSRNNLCSECNLNCSIWNFK